MSKSELVRPSRDGDQFHYLWAARRCLQLLSPASDLTAITVEGSSRTESADGDGIAAGEEIIDVGEYYGSEALKEATHIRYVQLKHSTVNADHAWTMSGLSGTLQGFADRYKEIVNRLDSTSTAIRVSFVFATNRPINESVRDAVEDAVHARAPRNQQTFDGLLKYTGLLGQDLSSFCALLHLEGEHEGFLAQRTALGTDLRGYLPDADQETLLLLKDLVTRKATSEFATNPSITKHDVLRVLGVEPDDLFPAENKIEQPSVVVPREQERELVKSIVEAGQHPVVVHADGGVGKSIFATRIGLYLPLGSVTVVYDCFGNGEYRAPSHPRHGARQALVQVVNELAGAMHCHPLIPSGRAEESRYFRAFLHRIKQAVTSIRQQSPDALLCIVFDAADNAEMAALEAGESASFARQLIRETLPDGVRLVMLCRTHRRYLLAAPPDAVELALEPFSRAETRAKLRSAFPDATDQDVDEFHRLSSCNPRVQSTALSSSSSLSEMLRNLGPEPKTVDEMIDRLLKQAVARAKDEVPDAQRSMFDRICTALALLRPMIPLEVLASISGTEAANARSFLADLGQAVLIKGTLVQFRDEPTETWFQQQFKPQVNELNEFIGVLRPQARTSAYVAAALPHLMLNAGRIDELITMALESSDLPDADTLGRRDIEKQRLHFALRASIRAKRYLDATKLALKAAGEAATESRQKQTLQDNTDLAGRFLEPTQILDLVSRRTFSSSWRGSHHVYDAGLFSGQPGFYAEAQSHLRMGHEWLRNWVSLPQDQREQERLEADDIAELSFAHLNVHGALRAAEMISRCISPQFRFDVAGRVARRLIDAGRLVDLNALADAGVKDTVLVAALALEAVEVGHALPREAVRRVWKSVRRLPAQTEMRGFDTKEQGAAIVAALALVAHMRGVDTPEHLSATLSRHLGTARLKSLSSRYTDSRPVLVKAYVLAAALAGRLATLDDLAHPDLQKALKKDGYGSDQGDAREFRARVGALLPWYQLWADVALDRVAVDDMAARLNQAQQASDAACRTIYSETEIIKNEVALAHAMVMVAAGPKSQMHIESLRLCVKQKDIFTKTLIRISWLAARSACLHELAIEFATAAAVQLEVERTEAAEKSDSWVALSRALLPFHRQESKHYFQLALDVASKIGDENLARWEAVIQVAKAAAEPSAPSPERAYRLARAAELTYEFVYRDKHFDWDATVEAIADICTTSAFAILSRWRDRNFGNCQRLLAVLVEHLCQQGRINDSVAASLYGFRADWSPEKLLRLVLAGTQGAAERQALADLLWNYMRLEQHGAETWREIHKVSEQFQVIFSGIDAFVAHAERLDDASKGGAERQVLTKAPADVMDWSPIFAGLDAHTLEGLSEARERYRNAKGHDGVIGFFDEAARKVNLGREADLLQTLGEISSFELYELRGFLENLPPSWLQQHSTITALGDLVRAMVARYCLEISIRSYYQRLPMDLTARVAKLPASEVIGVALDATADIAHPLGASALFNLVGLLTTKLDKHEAKEALDYELTRLESAMSEKDGDGPWNESLRPPTDVDTAVAGYLWAALAVPEASYRWEAAHAVRALCRLNCEGCVSALMAWLAGSPPGQFTDHNLVHYELHAHQWLLIGVARGALDWPSALAKHLSLLIDVALNSNSHVLIRGFAAQAALAVSKSPGTDIDPAMLEKLRHVNEPTINSAAVGRQPRWQRESFIGPRKPRRLHFGIDMPKYWFDRLGSRFGLGEDDMCIRVEKVILERWGISEERWDDDQRHRHKYIDAEATRHSHGSYPRADDLRFYYSYHAMMVVAGELLEAIPLPAPDDEWDTFQHWLDGHSLTRRDNRWISDRRDPEPFDYVDWSGLEDHDLWRWSVSRDDFERVLLPGGDMIVAAGRWVACAEPRREEIDISSVLVSAESAHALLRARQTSPDFQRDPPLPGAGREHELQESGFELKGWVVDHDKDSSLDQFDPWAADIRYPPLRPAAFVRKDMGLESDDEHRYWARPDVEVAELTSRTWGHLPAYRRDDREVNHGRRLEASMNILQGLVSNSGKCLIFEVSIHRRLSSIYQRSDDDDCVQYPAPYTRYFLLNADGTFTTV